MGEKACVRRREKTRLLDKGDARRHKKFIYIDSYRKTLLQEHTDFSEVNSQKNYSESILVEDEKAQ